jgi:rare lipoprotein A
VAGPALGLAACQQPAEAVPREQEPPAQHGQASYYGPQFTGRRTASGERFDPDSNVAAHRTLPLGTVARVTNLRNGRSATVRIADRGPYVRGRIVDLSPRTADRLGMRQQGLAPVALTPLSVPGQEVASNDAGASGADGGAGR